MSVYIKKVKISNYRSIKNEEFDLAVPNGQHGSGLTIVVGPNNVGKSNACRAIDALFNKFSGDDKTHGTDDTTSIEVEFISSDFEKSIETYVTENKQAAYKSAVLDGSMHAKRSDEESISKIFLKQSDGTYKNSSGIDAPFGSWMKMRTIDPEYTTDEATKYGTTSILGDLLGKIFKEIEEEKRYDDLKDAFKDLFEDNSIFEKKSKDVSEKVSGYIKEFYGEVGINFVPERPDLNALTKNVKTIVKDGSHDSEINTKGSGLQRAVIIALIQAYAASFEKSEHKKPFYLTIDEPELSLSAQGQKKLLNALRVITQREQIILVTHSPYFANWTDLVNGAKIGRATFSKKEGTKLHWLDSTSKYSELIDNSEKEWQKPFILDEATKEILFSNSVLMLEGQEDVGLVRKWANECDKLLPYDVFGYGVQGYVNFRPYLQMAQDTGLEKVAAIYDYGEAESKCMEKDSEDFSSFKLLQLKANDIRDKYRPCGNCEMCAIDVKKCKNKIQFKTGCFDEHGNKKEASEEFKNFVLIMDQVDEYFGGSDE
ncbi:AAA family ATPase [Candidatus Saccharibacteria bacterium]|nr:AAA family ATPase [Candidatus Saccharibacteria bacterium]MCB9821473.1 AAA family ATPase [Candidatus Nomurabacteria bacterium]